MKERVDSNTYMCVETFHRRVVATYSKGKIQKVDVRLDEEGVAFVTVSSDEGEFLWTTDKIFIVAYMMFGIPVSQDGKYLFVSRGVGYVGLAFRLGMRPEISVITLVKK